MTLTLWFRVVSSSEGPIQFDGPVENAREACLREALATARGCIEIVQGERAEWRRRALAAEAENERLRAALDRIAREVCWGKCGPRIDEDKLREFCEGELAPHPEDEPSPPAQPTERSRKPVRRV